MILRLGEERRERAARPPGDIRRGAALVEVVLALPLLMFMMVASTDFARAYHDLIIVTERARSGAIYASHNVGTPTTTVPDATWQAGTIAAALADKADLAATSQVTISPSKLSAIPASNPNVSVTVASPFQTIFTYPGIPSQSTITRTFTMRLQPTAYRMK